VGCPPQVPVTGARKTVKIFGAIELWRAIFPELVKKEDLTPALALNGIEFNLARAVGPGLAGLTIAAVGVATTFLLNALSFLGVILVIFRWKRPTPKSTLPARRSQRCSDSLRRLLTWHLHANVAVGNCHPFSQVPFGLSCRPSQRN
jgi:predicted MFS family arabinose efflux permease